jgi:hypothetical protein
MAEDVCLIWPSDKAKYFCFWGLTSFLYIRSDLPVGLILSPRINTAIACAATLRNST